MVSPITQSIAVLVLIASLTETNGFGLTQSHISNSPLLSTTSTSLHAKKKRNRKSSGQGFGKVPEVETPQSTTTTTSNNNDPQPFAGGLSSIESTTPSSYTRPQIDLDPNLPTNERNKEILKQSYGLRSFEDKQSDIKEAERMVENRQRMQKIKQMKDEEFDIFMVIPPSIIRAIDLFLKTGLAVTTTLFVLAGFGITAEAWSVATENTLPENVDSFIVNVIEPNFTPGLFVLLGFSVSLGIFATAQLGSGSSTYKEQ